MPHCDCNKFIEIFQQFRHRLYTSLPNRRDTLMDLLDALSSNQTAHSPVELSLNPLFRRNYSALYKAVAQFNFHPNGACVLGENTGSPEAVEQLKKQQSLQQVIAEIIPTPERRPFYLLGLDVTPIPRPYAQTLEERTFIYQPNPIKGNKVEGQQVWPPMWLIAIGSRRHQLTCLDIYQSYRQRFDLEHLWRFGKQRLLMAAFQTPEVKHEENWVQLTLLAYTQLWVARELAQQLPRPWERYLPTNVNSKITPSGVQRDFSRIIAQIGTPAASPKP